MAMSAIRRAPTAPPRMSPIRATCRRPCSLTRARHPTFETVNAVAFLRRFCRLTSPGLSTFKRFLDSILYSAEEHDLPRKRAILREYLETQKGRSRDDKHEAFLPTLIQAWDWAAENNSDAVLAQVTAVLALLLKVFASHDELTQYGTLLAKTILQPAVARRLVRSTSAASNKENVISPALRLLTELTRFNEGAHARAVYSKKDFTLEPRILGRNIALWKEHKGQSLAEIHKKPSVRTTAVRYLLTHLRLQDERAKIEILSNTNVTRALFDHLGTDPPFLIFEIFDVFKSHVFQDKTIPRNTKSRILNGKTLSRIAGLYNYNLEEGLLAEGEKAPGDLAHEFLCMVCTDPAYGVMLPTNGFYPSTYDDEDGDANMDDAVDNGNDLVLDSNETYDRLERVRNIILSEFIQSQRPYANTMHQKLVIEIFKACPELVADYFIKRRDFNYDPKLTSTWTGYSAFLFQTIQLPVPKYFGVKKNYRSQPPPVAVMIQSVLPQPLNQQVLTKCLNHSSDLIQLFAVRVLIVALQKLRSVVQELHEASAMRPSKQWEQASQRLVAEFSRRCPSIRTIFLALKKPGLKDMKRESITRLLRLYYEVTPQAALEEKFDVSLPLCNALVEVEKPRDSPEDKAFRIMELEHWIQMARHSPAMRWWQKPKTLQHSPFVTLLKLLVTSRENELYAGVKSLLIAILQDQEMLQTKTSPDALDALIASLEPPAGSSAPSVEVLEFLDDCCARFIKVPIKYFDDLDTMRSTAQVEIFSPLLMTLVEQWPFKGGETATGTVAEPLAQWLSKLLYLLKLIGEDESMLAAVRDALVESAGKPYKEVLKDAFLWKMSKQRAKESLKLATGADFSGSERSSASPTPQEEAAAPAKTIATVDLELPPQEDEKHAGLTRWRKKEIDEAIEDGDIGDLLLCLSSKHMEIRIQAISSIRQLMAKIGVSNEQTIRDHTANTRQLDTVNHDLGQVYILLGETLESVDTTGAEVFPYVGGVFAARCVKILADPTHSMFSKVNKFLTTAPAWEVDFLLRKLWRSIVGSESDEDGTYHKEVDWFLEYLIDALRTPRDMESFRKSNIFEQLLSFYGSRSCAASAKEKIVRLLLRAAAVGGSTTLITRCGLIGWIQMCLDAHDPRHRALRTLATRVHETCDQAKVAEWSSGTVVEAVASLVKVGA
jgi:nucleolar pre-ribosomal-associated protein 1